jgi:hypothetical protein
MVNKHKETEKSEKDLNVVISDLNVVIPDLNVAIPDLNVVIPDLNVVSDYCKKCPSCYKVFKTDKTLKKHLIVCKKIQDPNECEKCHKVFADRKSKSKHMSGCQSNQLIVATNNNAITTTNIQNQTNINIQNNNTFNIIAYDESSIEQILKDHVTKSVLKKAIDVAKPQQSFYRLANVILERRENRFIRKTNPKDLYSYVHTSENNWDFSYDKDIIENIVLEISCICLELLHDAKREKMHLDKTLLSRVITLAQKINEEEMPEYEEAIHRIKAIVVNLTNKEKIL